tara:strand:- start:755 stop:1348 length:594 start_codon:yes stop_codon:yes gene_type:complete
MKAGEDWLHWDQESKSEFFQNEPRISKMEFENPEHISLEVLEALQETRDYIARPMYFTYESLRSGRKILRHPHGDAVNPTSDTHAGFSLHKWGIDHSASKEEGKIVEDKRSFAKALDWDCNTDSLDGLFEVYLQLAQKTRWTGIGVYPFWNNKGFHTDLRDSYHPSFNAHWFRVKSGEYFPMTWSNWKREVINEAGL